MRAASSRAGGLTNVVSALLERWQDHPNTGRDARVDGVASPSLKISVILYLCTDNQLQRYKWLTTNCKRASYVSWSLEWEKRGLLEGCCSSSFALFLSFEMIFLI
jgi:hypothetical protein